jgi:L,D-peptidoglycan transpeptidase YkuD (ErfK/YbiS/YcfS/YnhG family)
MQSAPTYHNVETTASSEGVGLGPAGCRKGLLVVRVLSRAAQRGVLHWGGLALPCAIGRGGVRARKREGDGATPLGRWRLRLVFYRADRGKRPAAALPIRGMRPSDGWCDATADRNYNRPVRHPYPASAEEMWRADALYDVVVVLDYNERPRVRGKGSAIFMHVARPGFLPTEGCVALRASDLRKLLASLPRRAFLVIP